MPISLGELAKRFDCELIGDPDVVIDDVAALANASSNSLSFLSGSKFKKQLSSTKAAAVILRAEDVDACPTASLVSDNPYASYARMAAVIRPAPETRPGVHRSAVVAESAAVAAGLSTAIFLLDENRQSTTLKHFPGEQIEAVIRT